VLAQCRRISGLVAGTGGAIVKSRLCLVLTWVAIAAGAPSAALADRLDPTFQFANSSGGPVSRADFAIIPAGSVQAPVVGTDPATGLPKTASPVTIDPTRSGGFDLNNFSTALGTGTNVQGLRLLFGQKQIIQDGQVLFQPVPGPNGEPPRFLDSGGLVTFTLHLNPSFVGTVSLKSLTAGVPDPTLITTPEPATIGLWACAIAGLAIRMRRRPWQASPRRS
jgi:hypothetical protein